MKTREKRTNRQAKLQKRGTKLQLNRNAKEDLQQMRKFTFGSTLGAGATTVGSGAGATKGAGAPKGAGSGAGAAGAGGGG